ncbi:replication protein RepA, partial [Corynebacterium sp. HMSC071F07]|uniref:replication protein RepA n=1 Tax=Corynebacterium sp. HMSC071F07 TaxID=1715203 RepID=UPI001FEE358D
LSGGQAQLTKPRSMDIYIWLTLKQYWLAKNNRDTYTFTWDMMAASFATKELKTSAQWRDFRTDVKKAIQDILTIWPNAGITADTHGVTVTKTTTSIRQRPPRPRLD